jgi:nitroreductase/NAD-dependent dihydropyrimidine dehydrogenase PreA subunit
LKIEIDHANCKCKDTKLCTCVCPYGFIWETDENGQLGIAQEYEEYCINCGQCASICPTGALTLLENTEKPVKIGKNEKLSSDLVAHFLKTRRSQRSFKAIPLLQSDIESILDVTRWIPTASNKQQLKWMVINDTKKVQAIAGLTVDFIKQMGTYKKLPVLYEQGDDIVLRNAPCLIVVLGEDDYFWSATEAGIALTYLELYAYSKKMGTCWAGFFTRAARNYKPLIDYLDPPKGYKVCGGVMIGHPIFKLHSVPDRKEPDVIWK